MSEENEEQTERKFLHDISNFLAIIQGHSKKIGRELAKEVVDIEVLRLSSEKLNEKLNEKVSELIKATKNRKSFISE